VYVRGKVISGVISGLFGFTLYGLLRAVYGISVFSFPFDLHDCHEGTMSGVIGINTSGRR
jgi:hypothetical protein